MKKPFLALLAMASVCLVGCDNGNYQYGPASADFHYVHVQMYGMTEPIHLRVKSWKHRYGVMELRVTFGDEETSIRLGDSTYMMYDTKTCPICGTVEYR